jgi:hypothetical protein
VLSVLLVTSVDSKFADARSKSARQRFFRPDVRPEPGVPLNYGATSQPRLLTTTFGGSLKQPDKQNELDTKSTSGGAEIGSLGTQADEVMLYSHHLDAHEFDDIGRAKESDRIGATTGDGFWHCPWLNLSEGVTFPDLGNPKACSPENLKRYAARELDLARRPVRSLERLRTVRRIRIHAALNIERVECIHV